MAWMHDGRSVRCGSIIREIDGRHEARVVLVLLANHVPYQVRVRWLDSGWITEGLDVSDIEVVQR